MSICDDQLERAWATLTEAKGPTVAGLMREAFTQKYTTPESHLAAVHELMKVNGIEPEPAPATVSESAKTTASGGKTKRRSRHRSGPVNAKDSQGYLSNGGYYRMPNDFADTLLAVMPGPVLKAYVYAHRLARIDGTFYISHGTLAARIGAKSARHGRRVMSRLQEAGLLRLIDRGSAKSRTANTYQLVPLDRLDPALVTKTLERPLAPHRQGDRGPACP